MRHSLRATTLLLCVLCAGCSLTPPYHRPPMAIPEGWSAVTSTTTMPSQQTALAFWEEFGNAELNGVMQVALAQNLDLQAALHRVEQARAQVKVAGAALLPSIDASGGVSRTYQESSSDSSIRGLATLRYELDLWGKNRSQTVAARYHAAASAYDRAALQLVVTADTAVLYTQVLAFNDRLRIAEHTLQNAKEVLRIIEARYREGSASGLEVSQQKVVVNSIRSTLAALREQRTVILNALAILLSQAPQHFAAPEAGLAALHMPPVNLRPPASLLTGRPDIQSAEAGLLAANADIGAARAAFFPSLQLGTDASVIAAGVANPTSLALSLAADVLAPLFAGGRLQGNLASVTARQQELAAQYQKTVLTAFKEVEDALAGLKNAAQQVTLSRESIAEAQNAYTIAKARLDAGSIDYLTLLETQRSLSQAEDNHVVAAEAQLEAFVQLRKALGS